MGVLDQVQVHVPELWERFKCFLEGHQVHGRCPHQPSREGDEELGSSTRGGLDWEELHILSAFLVFIVSQATQKAYYLTWRCLDVGGCCVTLMSFSSSSFSARYPGSSFYHAICKLQFATAVR